jgi:DNA-directed RNA polymerase subunit L
MKFEKLSSENGIRFRLSEVDKSVANALRRTLIGNIPIYVMDPKKCSIFVNKTRFTNEIIASRLAAVPICKLWHDSAGLSDNYTISISVKNTSRNTMYITTRDFEVEHQGKKLDTTEIFPKNEYTQKHICFLRLKANLSAPEELQLECTTSVGTGNECGMYNSVGTCSYEYTHDIEAANEAKASIETDKEDWAVLDAKQLYVVKDSFDFVLDTIGIHTNREVLLIASIVLREQLEHCKMELTIVPSLNTIPHCFDVKMTGSYNHGTHFIKMKGDHSIGKMLEFILFKSLDPTYITFFKLHPHDEFGILRIAYTDATPESIKDNIIKACDDAIRQFEEFSTMIKDV